jgi:glycosyltransferase involved in cell wall biosynthesis
MGLGVPVVAFAVEGLPQLLGEGRGVLVEPGDVEALARAVEDVLAGRRRPDLEAGRRYAARFTPERVAPVYAAAYAELLEDRSGAVRGRAAGHPLEQHRPLAGVLGE